MRVDRERIDQLILELFRITDELSAMTGRPFTPDGHLVGSIGEVIAASEFGIELLPPSTRGRDARKGDEWIELKATFGNSVAFRRHDLDHANGRCIVLKLSKAPPHLERVVYNGPIGPILAVLADRPLASNGQTQISLKRLEVLDAFVAVHERVDRPSEGGAWIGEGHIVPGSRGGPADVRHEQALGACMRPGSLNELQD